MMTIRFQKYDIAHVCVDSFQTTSRHHWFSGGASISSILQDQTTSLDYIGHYNAMLVSLIDWQILFLGFAYPSTTCMPLSLWPKFHLARLDSTRSTLSSESSQSSESRRASRASRCAVPTWRTTNKL